MIRALVLLLVLTLPLASHAQDAHPAMRYSCMSDPPPGVAWPSVASGVPSSIEIQHPGYGIGVYAGFAIAGLRLFVIEGMRRAETVSERYAQVEAADANDTPISGRALFLRSIEGVTEASAIALRAMAILMRRADERPLSAAPSGFESAIHPPMLSGRTLVFWIRTRADQPYAREITVDLDAGTLVGDPG